MYNWWLLEKDLLDKMEHVIIPRFQEAGEPYTNLYRLPLTRYMSKYKKHGSHYTASNIGVIELKGNPFPEIEPLEEERVDAMYEYVRNRLRIPEPIEKK